jgi:hypothetical protein
MRNPKSESVKSIPNITISPEFPLIVSGTAATREYNYVVLEKGAYIRILDGAEFSAEALVRTLPSGLPESECIKHRGDPYPQSDIYSGFDIIIAGLDGVNGTDGGDGGSGETGGNGGSGGNGTAGSTVGQDFTLTVKNLQFSASVYYGGGYGGSGGNGGRGGKSSGTGVIGGYGGNGGDGGDGGDNSDLTLHANYSYVPPAPDSNCGSDPLPAPPTLRIKAAKSPAGVKGKGGDGGEPSIADNRGKDGSDGQNGRAGTVVINGKQQPKSGKKLLSLFKPGQQEIDFTDAEQAKAYIDLFGGEEYVSGKYPRFYAAWLKSKAGAPKGVGGIDNVVPQGLALSVINTVTPNNGEDKRKLNSIISFESVPPVNVFVQGIFTDVTEGALIDSCDSIIYADQYDNDSIFEHTLEGDVKDLFADHAKKLSALATCTYATSDGRLCADKSQEQTQALLGDSDLFASISLTAPKGEHIANQVNFVYGRPKDSDTDYEVTDDDAHVERNPDMSGKSTGVYLPVTGSFTAGEHCTPIAYSAGSQTTQTQLQYGNEGIVYYGPTPAEIAGFFSINEKDSTKVDFNYAPYWGDRARIDCARFGTNGTFNLNLSAYYRFNTAIGEMEGAFGIKSKADKDTKYYTSENSAMVYVPPIHIQWGCFGKRTLIKMYDGTDKLITELQAGDLVKSDDGSSAEVLFIGTGGHEDKLVHIETIDGSAIDITDMHPVKTANGTVRACDIRPNDIVCVDGGTAAVKYVYLADYDDEVCSIRLNGSKFCIGNGFVTGDLDVQSDTPGKPKPELTAEVKALSDEMALAFNELI